MDELEWIREDQNLSDAERDQAVTDLIELVVAVDGILQAQSEHDAQYFVSNCGRPFNSEEVGKIQAVLLKAYRWQYIISGVQVPQFNKVLGGMINEAQGERIKTALGTLI